MKNETDKPGVANALDALFSGKIKVVPLSHPPVDCRDFTEEQKRMAQKAAEQMEEGK